MSNVSVGYNIAMAADVIPMFIVVALVAQSWPVGLLIVALLAFGLLMTYLAFRYKNGTAHGVAFAVYLFTMGLLVTFNPALLGAIVVVAFAPFLLGMFK